MDLDFLDGSAPELKAWLTDHGGYLFEERPEAVHCATIGLRAAFEGTDRRADFALSYSTRDSRRAAPRRLTF
jgi:hypothetical protein